MKTMRKIDFEILRMKGFKVEFGVLKKKTESWKSPGKGFEIFF